MKQDIGINQRIPMNILELALLAELQGNATGEYFRELASTEYNGQNRIGKAVSVMNRLTKKNRLMPYLMEKKTEVEAMLRNQADKPLLLTAIICSAYGFGYDVVALLGKYFHAQEIVTTELPNALYCILPMLIEAKLLERPEAGKFKAIRIKNATDEAKAVYQQAFLLNNPMLSEKDNIESYSFFEFIK